MALAGLRGLPGTWRRGGLDSELSFRDGSLKVKGPLNQLKMGVCLKEWEENQSQIGGIAGSNMTKHAVFGFVSTCEIPRGTQK